MHPPPLKHITLIGSGRVATQLGRRLMEVELPLKQVISRTAAHARQLGEELGIGWSDAWRDVSPETDWVIIAVKDGAIASVAEQLEPYAQQALVTHTSGATSGAVLQQHFERYGVFYPLQTFNLDTQPDWPQTPLCVDANIWNC